jgi:hypothetical protein
MQSNSRDAVIDHPHHYNNSGIQCSCGRPIECIDITSRMDFVIGNTMKYLWRYKDKNGLEDLRKAAWYLNYAIEHYEEKCLS